MRKLILSLIFYTSILNVNLAQQYDHKCAVDPIYEQQVLSNPSVIQRNQELERFTAEWIANNQNQASVRDIITIPVVVHVIWNEPVQNVPDLQVFTQMGIINEDFQMRNDNLDNIPEVFKGLVANVEFEFCLATVAPNGTPTTGITRTFTENPCLGNFNLEVNPNNGKPKLFHTEFGGVSPWNPDEYLNIWVAPTCGSFLGFAFNPGQSEDPDEDGVVINSGHFGNVCNDGSFHHLGRTLTHEIGHYFNLKHIWGKDQCDGDDFVEDTPNQSGPYRGCPQFPQSSCGSEDMFMNYMDFTDDACIAMFTHGQKLRMLAALFGPRAGLLSSSGCDLIRNINPDLGVIIYPNPAKDCIHIDFKSNFEDQVDVYLFDAAGKTYYHVRNNPSNIRAIDSHNLANGIYFLHITNGTNSFTERVSISK